MDDKQQAIRDRDVIDIEALQRQVRQVRGGIPRMSGHYVESIKPGDAHIHNYLFSALSLLDLADQQLERARQWIMPDDEEEDV